MTIIDTKPNLNKNLEFFSSDFMNKLAAFHKTVYTLSILTRTYQKTLRTLPFRGRG